MNGSTNCGPPILELGFQILASDLNAGVMATVMDVMGIVMGVMSTTTM